MGVQPSGTPLHDYIKFIHVSNVIASLAITFGWLRIVICINKM